MSSYEEEIKDVKENEDAKCLGMILKDEQDYSEQGLAKESAINIKVSQEMLVDNLVNYIRSRVNQYKGGAQNMMNCVLK